MFVARDAKGKLVNALEKDVTKQAYTCPACGGGLRLRQGQSIRTHFAHERLRDCIAIFENESPEHLGNKEALYHWVKKDNQVALEYSLPGIQQVADVLVNGKLALEVQCSPLSQKLLGHRSQGYRSQGYQVIWLLGEKLWLKERLTQLQRGFLYFSQNMGFFVWELDLKRKILRLKYLLHQDLRGKLHFQVKEFPYGKGNLLEILRFPYQKQKTTSFCSCARFHYLSLHSPTVVLSNALLDEEARRGLSSRRQSIKPSTGRLVSSGQTDRVR